MNTLVKRNNSVKRGIPSIFDELFSDNVFAPTFSNNFNSSVPSVNIKENENEFALELSIPGLSKEDVKIELENDLLTISSEKKTEEASENEKYTRKEFSFSSFKRSFSLPETVNTENIEANHKDGILHITLPKKEEAKPQPPKAISIK